MLTVGSLFAGIGGFDLGLERAGMRTIWQVEQDEFCRRVLARHFPAAHRFNDVREVTGDRQRWAEHGGTLLEYVDVICGGFPCQDISLAGAGAGIEGERSGLWSEYARLVGELRPRYVIVENVAALLGRGLGVVLADLAALGYDAEWDCIPASAVGAPHRRDRIWLVAYPHGQGEHDGPVDAEVGGASQPVADTHSIGTLRARTGGPRRGELANGGGAIGGAEAEDEGRTRDGTVGDAYGVARPAPGARDRERGAVAQPSPLERPLRSGGSVGDAWLVEPDVGRVAHGVPARVDRLKALGNSLVPQVAEWIGCRILEWEEEGSVRAA